MPDVKVFGDDGEEIDPALEEVAEETDEVVEEPADEEVEETEVEEPAPAKGKAKYRIGDKEFDTAEEAHAYATSVETESNENDAYRRIVKEALLANPPAESVTPDADDIDETQLFENPKEFLKKFAEKIETKTVQRLDQTQAQKTQSDAIWREFSDRHPALADFRNEAEMITGQNLALVQKLVKTKGQAAAYDFIALKMREDFSRKANALKPSKQLSNKSAATTPSGTKPAGVTPKPKEKKPLSFAEQIRSIKKRK